MNKYLIDTHILWWWLLDDPQLPSDAREIISSEDHLIYVSAVCVWELMIKKGLGKISAPSDLKEALLDSHFLNLDIDFRHAFELENLEKHHRDPFDRMLISQAMIEQIPIITHDKIFQKYEGVDVILV